MSLLEKVTLLSQQKLIYNDSQVLTLAKELILLDLSSSTDKLDLYMAAVNLQFLDFNPRDLDLTLEQKESYIYQKFLMAKNFVIEITPSSRWRYCLLQ